MFALVNAAISVVDKPARSAAPAASRSDALSFGTLDACVERVQVLDGAGEPTSVFRPGDAVRVRIACVINKDLTNLNIGVRIRNKQGVKMYSWGTLNQDISIWSGRAWEIAVLLGSLAGLTLQLWRPRWLTASPGWKAMSCRM